MTRKIEFSQDHLLEPTGYMGITMEFQVLLTMIKISVLPRLIYQWLIGSFFVAVAMVSSAT